MANRPVSVLVIEKGSSAGLIGCRGSVGEQATLSGGPGQPVISCSKVQELEDAADRVREDQIDALLLSFADVDAIAWLRHNVTHQPILAVAEDDLDTARLAIDAGADDVLLPSELAEDTLSRRILLAIARKGSERRQVDHARQDMLTGLANGALLEERFDRALARADRYATLVGLVAIDLDGFDKVTASHGRSNADEILTKAGQRLFEETRQTDTLARTRDHGFTWLVEGLAAIDDIGALVDRLPNRLAQPFRILNHDIRVTASVGVAIAPFHGRDFQSVLNMAEAAMIDVSSISGDASLMLPVPAAPKVNRSAALV